MHLQRKFINFKALAIFHHRFRKYCIVMSSIQPKQLRTSSKGSAIEKRRKVKSSKGKSLPQSKETPCVIPSKELDSTPCSKKSLSVGQLKRSYSASQSSAVPGSKSPLSLAVMCSESLSRQSNSVHLAKVLNAVHITNESNSVQLAKESNSVHLAKDSNSMLLDKRPNFVQKKSDSKVSNFVKTLKRSKHVGKSSKRSKFVPPSEESPDVHSQSIPEISESQSTLTSGQSSYKSLSKKFEGMTLSKASISIPLQNESHSEVWTKWKPIVSQSTSSKKKEQKTKANKPKPFVIPVCSLYHSDKKPKTQTFENFAKVVYRDLLDFHKDTHHVPTILENSKFYTYRINIRDLFFSKINFFRTTYNIKDPKTNNFYQMFLSWGVGLLSDDMSEDRVLEFFIKVCCCTIYVVSEFPCLEKIVKANAITAIAEFCVICSSKRPEFELRIEEGG